LCLQLIAGNKVEKVCELAHITLNKNAVFGDSSALSPGGVRVGKYYPSCSYSWKLRTLLQSKKLVIMDSLGVDLYRDPRNDLERIEGEGF
jgi:hypothetical protein